MMTHWNRAARAVSQIQVPEQVRPAGQRLKILDGHVAFEIILTTYNMVFSEDDKKLFKKYMFQYIVFDEAHLVKNMKTNRYVQLMRIKSHRRLLLTGTPLQINLLELIVPPDLYNAECFRGKDGTSQSHVHVQ